ncbi:MAG: tRNA lysidine(34) synthetase TilS [Bacteroidales bacterium]|nr:tRNA lysidine(34) synthetase TilS [Bacteroidales bacterium]
MLTELNKYSTLNQLFDNNSAILVAVSGGIDSVTLLHLLSRSKIKKLAIAHCNFHLRGEESDKDEKFVTTLAKQYNLPFFITRFETEEFAKIKRISIQEAARTLRYLWFEEIRQTNNFDWIAVGHNKDDVAETFLFNLVRGTGTTGLTGIKPKTGKIIRPLLFATRSEITVYGKQNNLQYREDSSNRSDKYSRNFIRHKIIPLLKDINPQATKHIFEATQKLNETNKIAGETIREFTNRIVLRQGNKISVSVTLLLKQQYPLPFLHHILEDYGFNPKELSKILTALSQPGRQFFSTTHTLLTDRDFFYVYRTPVETTEKNFEIKLFTPEITDPINLKFLVVEKTTDLQIKKNPRYAFLNYDKISFPLTIRKWQNGDSFHPFGMNGQKKLSDYFVDRKFSLLQKQEIWVMETGGKICWLIGEQIDNRFAVTNETKQILQIEKTEQTGY